MQRHSHAKAGRAGLTVAGMRNEMIFIEPPLDIPHPLVPLLCPFTTPGLHFLLSLPAAGLCLQERQSLSLGYCQCMFSQCCVKTVLLPSPTLYLMGLIEDGV